MLNKIDFNKMLVPAITMLVIDIFFLYNFAGYIGKMIERIQNKKFKINYPAAIACYSIMIFTYYYFIIEKNGNSFDAFILGLSLYSVYETTNMATIDGWQLKAVVYDSLWGGSLFLLTKVISDSINRLKPE